MGTVFVHLDGGYWYDNGSSYPAACRRYDNPAGILICYGSRAALVI